LQEKQFNNLNEITSKQKKEMCECVQDYHSKKYFPSIMELFSSPLMSVKDVIKKYTGVNSFGYKEQMKLDDPSYFSTSNNCLIPCCQGNIVTCSIC
jgi:hypothetical protein